MPYDPHYSSVSLLLHGDGADGSTTFTDSGPSARTVTAVGNAKVSTTQSKYGGASLYFDGSGDKATAAASADFVFGADDFTLEGWVYITGGQNYARMMHFGGYWSTNDSFGILAKDANNAGKISFASYKLGRSRLCVSTTSVSTNTWYHVAVTRSSGVFRLFVDGVLEATNSSYVGVSIDASVTNTLAIGSATTTSGGEDYGGYIDDVRITKGVARYTATFTPPTEAYPNNGPDGNYVIASAPTPLGAPAAVAKYGHGFYCRSSAPTPLGTALVLANAPTTVKASAPTPLGIASAYALTPFYAWANAPTPLGSASVVGYIPTAARAKAPSPLGACLSVALHDFTGAISPYAVTRYVMDLITPSGTVRVPISSWQATLRTGASSYVQCVIPAAQPWGAAINAATSFRIYRRAVTTGGQVFEYLMAEAPADTPQFDRGPTNPTCTLSGYAPGFAGQDVSPGTDRTLTGIRSISSGASYRVRCAVDWLLRPGQRGVVDGVPFVVEWINYYVNTNDAYMEVGT